MTLRYPEIARICRELGLLLHAGISMAEGVCLLSQEEPEPLKGILEDMGSTLDQGAALFEALAQTGAFPEYLWTMVQVGEETGRLEESLLSLADFYEERHRTLLQIRSAVAYPAAVMLLMLAVIGVLLVKVVPVFDRVYASLGSRLTGPAAGLLYLGRGLEHSLPVLLGILALIAGAAALLRFCPGLRKQAVNLWQQRFGDRGISRKFANARFARAMAMGLGSGLSPERALELAENLLLDNPGAARRCAACGKAMESGTGLADAAEDAKLLPPAQSRLLRVGIRSGNGDRVLDTIARNLLEDAQNALEEAISQIEPAMVLLSSLLVGLILLSVMLPLVDILSVLG